MGSWEEDFYSNGVSDEEFRLLKKFDDYVEMEKKAVENAKNTKVGRLAKILERKYVVIALVEGTILIGLASAFVHFLL